MTPQIKERVKNVSFWTAIILGLIAWTARAMVTSVDTRYVHQTEFSAYQQNLALQHQRDSLVAVGQFKSMMDTLRTTGKGLKACIRHRDSCDE